MIVGMTFLPCLGGGRSVDWNRARRLFFAAVATTAVGFLSQQGVAAAESTGTSVLPHVAARLAQHQPLSIIAFGSSSTEGVGASSPAHAYPAQLQVDLATWCRPSPIW
jgi:hypothetical protein